MFDDTYAWTEEATTHSSIMSTGGRGDAYPTFLPFDQWDVLFYNHKAHYAIGIHYSQYLCALMTGDAFKSVLLKPGPPRGGKIELVFLLPVDGDTIVSQLRINLMRETNKRKQSTSAKPRGKAAAKKPRLSKTAKK